MKNINHQEVIIDIEKRMKFFEEIRINKILTKEKESNTQIKEIDFVETKSHLTFEKEDLFSNGVLEKIENITKKNDSFLKVEDHDVLKPKKEATKSFFKVITNFFDGKSNETNLDEAKTITDKVLEVDKIDIKSKNKMSGETITNSKKIKAEKN